MLGVEFEDCEFSDLLPILSGAGFRWLCLCLDVVAQTVQPEVSTMGSTRRVDRVYANVLS